MFKNFFYWDSALSDAAKEVIDSLEITNDNYRIALELLQKRFINKRLTIRQHVQAILDIEPIQRESVSSLRALVDDILKHLRALENLEEPVNQWDTLIVHLISSQLDSAAKREWESKVISDKWFAVDELTEYLSDRCQLLETVQANKPMSHSNKQNKLLNPPNKKS